MPSNRVHCAISKKRTEQTFEELHHWIDEYSKELGIEHRIKRHYYNKENEQYILNHWGDKAVVEWLFHIALDNLRTAYKKSFHVYGDKTFNLLNIGLFNSGYIGLECYHVSEEELKNKFIDDRNDYSDDDHE